MSQSAATLESGFRLLLQPDDQTLRDLSDLDRSQLETLRTAIDYTLAQRESAEPEPPLAGPEAGFTCEWWPPD